MNNKQKEIIIRNANTGGGWFAPANQDVEVLQIFFDISCLLPDENVESFLKDCPRPARWACLECDGSENDWYYIPMEEQLLWAVTMTINPEERAKNNTEEQYEKLKYCKQEQGLSLLIEAIVKITDYTDRKSKDELQAMYDEAEKIRMEGPPK